MEKLREKRRSLQSASDFMPGHTVGHGPNSVDGASGPGTIYKKAAPGCWCGAFVGGQPALEKYKESVGHVFESSGLIVWTTTAVSLRALLAEKGIEITQDLAALPDSYELYWDSYSW